MLYKLVHVYFWVSVSVAMLVPDLEPFISLVGAIFFSFLGIFIPAVVETVSCWECHLGAGKWRLWKNGFLMLIALCALVSGTWISVLDIIALYDSDTSLPVSNSFNSTTESILATTLGLVNNTETLQN
jgi:hypothetical protein